MPACRDCGSTDIELDEPADDGWFSILVTLSDQVPSEDHCLDWLDSKGISDNDAEQTALSIRAKLRYDPKKKAWMYGKTEHYDIWATFQVWCLRDLRENGRKPGTSMKVKEGGRY